MLDETLGAPTSRDDDRRVPGGNLPAHVWLLLIAAAIQVAVLWMSRSAVTQPLPLSSIVGIVSNVTSFVLAAAVLVGRRRWPSGKRWLVAGAAAFAVIGLFDLGRDLWFAAQPYGNLSVDVTSQTLMRVRGTIVAALAIAAPFLLGVGLWMSHHERASRARVAAMLVVGIVGFVATVGGMLEVSISLGVAPQPPQPFDDPLLILTGLNAAGFAVLAVAATRNLSSFRSLPELLIAAGATIWLAVDGWVQWWSFSWLSAGPAQSLPEGWSAIVTLTNVLMLVGILAVIVGFGSARLVGGARVE